MKKERHIYTQQMIDFLREIQVDSVVTYDQMDSVIGLNTRPNQDGYGYQESARRILESQDGIVFHNIRKVGYRRMSAGEVATSSVERYSQKKRSNIRREKRRIDAISDEYDSLSSDEKTHLNCTRTMIAFDYEMSKPKKIEHLKTSINTRGDVIGFGDTLKLFE